MMRPLNQAMLAGLAALTLSACVSFGAEPPPFLLTLSADEQAPVGRVVSSGRDDALVLENLSAPQKLNTLRLPVARGGSTIAYLKDAVWVERPTRLFQNLIGETLSARSERLVLSTGEAGPSSAARLSGQVVDFGLDGPALQVVVTFDAMATDADGNIRKRRFEARESVFAAEAAPVGEALNIAANKVAGEVADWFLE